ncbi:hypothetical protein Bsp3421_002137 [Burkholderia sp. FERM BP-3421]|uniref:hypothetical protein n=1 Tax=Burkholderia sp. FERM BP-3421 TaxID=1494466 RepID=UPI00236048CD|nr:hypothetical protein [Burkholderia sp. FERM BP-3421]WDD92151.1 hypothetical protein Bsp3421_002137 [Burkholderia sp. FERM BP-3421]
MTVALGHHPGPGRRGIRGEGVEVTTHGLEVGDPAQVGAALAAVIGAHDRAHALAWAARISGQRLNVPGGRGLQRA